MPGVQGGQKKMSDSLELKLDSCKMPVGPGNRTEVLQEQQVILSLEPSFQPLKNFSSLRSMKKTMCMHVSEHVHMSKVVHTGRRCGIPRR